MTEKKKSPEDFFPECMRQQTILLTGILDVTKQIEVQSREQRVDLRVLAEERQVYIDRLKKCRAMIDTVLRDLPEDRRERRKKIISGRLPEEECTAEEKEMLALGKKSAAALRDTLALDREARARLTEECSNIQKRLRAARAHGRQKAIPGAVKGF